MISFVIYMCKVTKPFPYRYFDSIYQISVGLGIFIFIVRSPAEFFEQDLSSVSWFACSNN